MRGGEHVRMGPSARDLARNLPAVWTYHGCCDSELERVRGEEARLACDSAPRRCPWEGGGGKMVTTDFSGSYLPAHLVLLFSIQPDVGCSHLPQKRPGMRLWVWGAPIRALAQSHLMYGSGLPQAQKHFPCSVEGCLPPGYPGQQLWHPHQGWLQPGPRPLAWPTFEWGGEGTEKKGVR